MRILIARHEVKLTRRVAFDAANQFHLDTLVLLVEILNQRLQTLGLYLVEMMR